MDGEWKSGGMGIQGVWPYPHLLEVRKRLIQAVTHMPALGPCQQTLEAEAVGPLVCNSHNLNWLGQFRYAFREA